MSRRNREKRQRREQHERIPDGLGNTIRHPDTIEGLREMFMRELGRCIRCDAPLLLTNSAFRILPADSESGMPFITVAVGCKACPQDFEFFERLKMDDTINQAVERAIPQLGKSQVKMALVFFRRDDGGDSMAAVREEELGPLLFGPGASLQGRW